ncbi:acyl-CoA/acyl-ACP dehydrogenase [Kroppenstedtia pulmonis]|uniref:Acyl-CoA/acyl-ACP dehydrogenase n=1 Tax=Kroppenstedtia pulmonis TaxID=1380685 RepID=A0A7D3XJ10_9BACL|nr:acyl-CoA dehydrogenase family protein [Kroppenstedtia pulmonis]QKG84459.1 acyl-CoA/acyl-ACP dehydrogenase [Kroppenstedtia pulmonis]
MSSLFVKTKRQQELYREVSQLADRFSESSAHIDKHGIFPTDQINALRNSGYSGLVVPKKYGGEGITVYDMVLLQERLAKGDAAIALCIGWHLGVLADIAEKKRWNEEVFEFIAGETLKGALVNRAATEAQTGSPTRGGRPQTHAVKQNGKWIINGRKTFTTMAPVLDYFLVTAWIEEKQAVGEFLLHKDLKGIKIEETWDMIAMRGTGSHDLILTDVEVDRSMLVEVISKPRSAQVNGWLLHIPACYLGIAGSARDYAVEFANQYSPNSLNGPIKELPHIQSLVGKMELELLQARHFLFSVAEAYCISENRHLLGSELAAVKYTVTNTAISVVDKAMRIVGAKSLHRTNPLQRYYRDVRAGLHNPPMDDATLVKLAHNAFNLTN